ncbi:MAG TPA: transferase [Burkholderiaceae bacterium]|nr:transferase [Burkholderiaceae bacterium]
MQHPRPFILETDKSKSLHFSANQAQSRMSVARPDALNMEYTRLMMGFLLFNSQPEELGLIGLGGGSLAKFCYRYLSGTRIVAVEINPHVVAVRDEFQVPRDDERFSVVLGDGADLVRAAREKFDALLVDGFDVHGMPAQLSSQDFYGHCFAALKPDGFLVLNLDRADRQFETCIERVRNSFGKDEVLLVIGNDGNNGIVFACKGQRMARHAIGTLRRPATLAPEAWTQLTPGFTRVAAALREQRGWLTPAGSV